MGGGTYTKASFSASKSTRGITDTTSVNELYQSRSMPIWMDPKNIKIRESRDSQDNPQSTPIITALDVTGSMGSILQHVGTIGLEETIKLIHETKIITNPHIMVMGFGDVNYDHAPLQVTEFEADVRMIEQLSEIYFERGGGGNDHESYNLPWYFAAFKTSLDSVEKRNKKGFLFTIGDELPPHDLSDLAISKVFGESSQLKGISNIELLKEVRKKFEVHHIVVLGRSNVYSSWQKFLGKENVTNLNDHTKIPETIVKIIKQYKQDTDVSIDIR